MLQQITRIDALAVRLGLHHASDIAVSHAEADFVTRALCLGPGARLLDAPCGIGRHTIAFAVNGLIVIGADSDPAAIEVAHSFAVHPSISFVLADLTRESVVPTGSQDAVASLYSCIGYGDYRRADVAMLSNFAAALRPSGRLIIGTANGRAVLRGEPRDSTFFHRDYRIDRYDRPEAEAGLLHRLFRVTTDSGPSFEIAETRKLYGAEEMSSMLSSAGFDVISMLADYSGTEFDPESSQHALYLCRRGVT